MGMWRRFRRKRVERPVCVVGDIVISVFGGKCLVIPFSNVGLEGYPPMPSLMWRFKA